MNIFFKIGNYVKSNLKYYKLKSLDKAKYKSFYEEEYLKRTGEVLNIDHPQKFTEKMQFAKLNLNTPLKSKLSDKFEVRDWVKNKIGPQYLIPLLGVWDDPTEIDFDSLPEQFVLKMNNGSGTNIFINNKEDINKKEILNRFKKWFRKNFAYIGDLQPHYAGIKPRVIAEMNIKVPNENLIDYRFICFDGKVHYCWVDFYTDNNIHYSNIYNTDWELQPWRFEPMENTPYSITRPEKFDEMLELATRLAQNFSHVRVDLYNVNGKIYFGEMTFTSTGGFRLIKPETYNYKLGDLWDISGDN